MKSNPTKSGLVAFAALGLFVPQLSGAVINYNFDALSPGALSVSGTPSTLGNQDSWYWDSATGAGSVATVATAPSGAPTAQSLQNTAGQNSVRAIRNFGSTIFTGTETTAQFSFTFQKAASSWSTQMSLAGDGSPTSTVSGNGLAAFGPRLGFVNSNQFAIAGKRLDGLSWDNTGSYSATSAAQSLTLNHWYTVTATIDFTANGGDGSASVSYFDLADGTPITVLTGINMGLTHNSATYAADKWNQVWFRSDAGGTFPAGAVQLSSFTVNPIPEPASAVLVALGGLALSARRRRMA